MPGGVVAALGRKAQGGLDRARAHRESHARLRPGLKCQNRMRGNAATVTTIGRGTRIWAFAHVLPGAVIGADCKICDHTFIENEARIGDRATIECGVQRWDGITIEDDVFIGAMIGAGPVRLPPKPWRLLPSKAPLRPEWRAWPSIVCLRRRTCAAC